MRSTRYLARTNPARPQIQPDRSPRSKIQLKPRPKLRHQPPMRLWPTNRPTPHLRRHFNHLRCPRRHRRFHTTPTTTSTTSRFSRNTRSPQSHKHVLKVRRPSKAVENLRPKFKSVLRPSLQKKSHPLPPTRALRTKHRPRQPPSPSRQSRRRKPATSPIPTSAGPPTTWRRQ